MVPIDLVHGGAQSSRGAVGVASMLLVPEANRVDEPEIRIKSNLITGIDRQLQV